MKEIHVNLLDLRNTPIDAPYCFDVSFDFYVKERKESYIVSFYDLEPQVLEADEGKSENIVSISDVIIAHVMQNDYSIEHVKISIAKVI